jgi:hypothetical protein
MSIDLAYWIKITEETQYVFGSFLIWSTRTWFLKVCPSIVDRPSIDEIKLCCRGSVDVSVCQSTSIDGWSTMCGHTFKKRINTHLCRYICSWYNLLEIKNALEKIAKKTNFCVLFCLFSVDIIHSAGSVSPSDWKAGLLQPHGMWMPWGYASRWQQCDGEWDQERDRISPRTGRVSMEFYP